MDFEHCRITRDKIRERIRKEVEMDDPKWLREHPGWWMETARKTYNAYFAPYAWPGGATILFYQEDGTALCHRCAKRLFLHKDFLLEDRSGVLTLWRDVYDEGPDILCEECNIPLESTYGDPYAAEEEEWTRRQ